MEHFSKYFNPDMLGSWDLLLENGSYGESVFTIKDVQKQEVVGGDGKKKMTTVLLFEETHKGMIMSANENWRAFLKVMQTPDVNKWKGRQITVFVKPNVKAFGNVVDALRIKPFAPAIKPAKKDILTPEHPSFAKVKAAIESGAADMAQARSKFEISADVEALLTGGAK
jgi:hypothetical protein